jgi:cytochrome P450
MTETSSQPTSYEAQSVPKITGVRAVRVAAELGFAAIAAGVIVRRPLIMAGLERVQADAAALRVAQQLRREFGRGPVELVLPGRRIVVVLHPEDVGRVLAESPDPFTPANREKKAALSPFQPHAVLISEGPLREQRRLVNVVALDTPRELHRLAAPFASVIHQEADEVLRQAKRSGVLTADDLLIGWWKAVRRITLGDAARTDETTTDILRKLRAAGNWSFLSRPHPFRRERFFERLYGYLQEPQAASLAGALGEIPTTPAVDPIGQMPHWLFAFDAAGIALSRTLALLSSHPAEHQRALAEIGAGSAEPRTYDFLRNCVLESVRLWPTTPTILRDSTSDTYWGEDRSLIVKSGAAVMIQLPTFHRDPDLADYADQFSPDIWADGTAAARPDLVPFSAGPARCPGQNLVLFTTSTFLAHLIDGADFTLNSHPQLSADAPLPATLNNFNLRFRVA